MEKTEMMELKGLKNKKHKYLPIGVQQTTSKLCGFKK